MCPGCTMATAFRAILNSISEPTIVAHATGCGEICIGNFPFTAAKFPWIHSLFENAPSVISGVAAAIESKKRRGEIPAEKNFQLLAVGGDGAFADIGLNWLSGAFDRETPAVFVCFDNEGFMNTGHQKSATTPFGGATSTTPAGKLKPKKNLMKIAAAHGVKYAAQTSAGNIFDLQKKAQKAFATPGASFLNILCACPTNWKFKPADGIEILKLATATNFWPLFEIENGNWKLNSPRGKTPLVEFLQTQKRFAPLLKNPENLKIAQNLIDENFAEIEKLAGAN